MEIIRLTGEDIREALRIIREIQLAKEHAHAMEHQLSTFEQQLGKLYGVPAGATEAAVAVLDRVVGQLVAGGLDAPLALPDGTPLRLVPVLEVWPGLPASWPGLGRAGVDRGPGLDGPRATLSVLRRPRLGRHRLDLEGVRDSLVPRQ
jgi:hypothetical protein